MNSISHLSKSRLILDVRTLVLTVTIQASSASCRSRVSRPSALAILRNSSGLYGDAAGDNGKNEFGEHDRMNLSRAEFEKGDSDLTVVLLGTGTF